MLLDKIAKAIINRIPEEKREDIVLGITAGIVGGIAAGIVLGITAGITAGIGDFIVSSLSFFSILIIIAMLFIISEMLFLFDKKKPEGQTPFIFTVKRKAIAWLEPSIILFSLIGISRTTLKSIPILRDFLGQYGLTIMNIIGWGTAAIIVLYLYIKINSLKYKER